MSRDMKNILSNCSWRDVNKKKIMDLLRAIKRKKYFSILNRSTRSLAGVNSKIPV